MVAIRSDDANAFLAKSSKKLSVFLFHGTDAGQISEHCRTVSQLIGVNPKDPFQYVRLDGDEIASDPSKLLDETNTIGLFGGLRLIRIELGSSDISGTLELALGHPNDDWKLVIQAGLLKHDSPVRRFCEVTSAAVAIECNPDSETSLAELVSRTFQTARVAISSDVREFLIASLGADRLATRSELEKLTLYMHGLENLELADVEAISADASNVAIDRVIRAAFSGNVTELDDSIKRLSAGGADGGVLLGGALREAINLNLHTTSHGQYGASPGVQRGYRHFNRISIDQHSANRWTSTKARQAIEIVAAASAHARRNADLALELAGRALWSIAYIARG